MTQVIVILVSYLIGTVLSVTASSLVLCSMMIVVLSGLTREGATMVTSRLVAITIAVILGLSILIMLVITLTQLMLGHVLSVACTSFLIRVDFIFRIIHF